LKRVRPTTEPEFPHSWVNEAERRESTGKAELAFWLWGYPKAWAISWETT